MKTVIITQQQLNEIMVYEASQVLCEAKGVGVKGLIKKLILKGVALSAIIIAIMQSYNVDKESAEQIVNDIQTEITKETPIQQPWQLIASDVMATVYNAEPKQCNKDITHTASMFRLNLQDVYSHRIIAMERTMMAKYGLKYGDVVKIEGTGKYDGIWQIQDTMNKRFAGQNKIDILVPKKYGLGAWNNVKVYKLTNPNDTNSFKETMAPQLSKEAAKQQIRLIKSGKFKIK